MLDFVVAGFQTVQDGFLGGWVLIPGGAAQFSPSNP